MAVTPIVPTTFAGNLTTTLGGTPVAEYGITIPPDSSVHYNAGLDISTNEGDYFIISPGCTSNFGSSGTTLKLDLDGATYTGSFTHAGGGKAYVTPTTAIARTRKIGPGDLVGVGGTWAQVEVSQGQASFDSDADVQIIYALGGATTIDEHASDTIDTAVVNPGASLAVARTAGSVTVYGSFVQSDRTATLTTLTIAGGSVLHNGGTITTCNGYAGKLDLSGVSANVTITTLNRYSEAFTIIPPRPPFALTVTTENYFGDATTLGV